MPRYRAFWVEDEHFMPDMRSDPLPDVIERGPSDTGLVDQHGNGDFDHTQALWNLLVVEGFLLAEATRSDEGSMAGRRVA